MKKSIGVYIHIPFCVSKCYYCDFVSFAGRDSIFSSYVDALIMEIENSKLDKYIIETVYIGGGTPSILDSKYIGRILEAIRPNISEKAEVTIEVNPGTVSEEKLKAYTDYGVNRLSIGLQSTDDGLLKQIGRIHSFKQFLETYKLACKVRV